MSLGERIKHDTEHDKRWLETEKLRTARPSTSTGTISLKSIDSATVRKHNLKVGDRSPFTGQLIVE